MRHNWHCTQLKEGGDLQQHLVASPTAKLQNTQCKNTEKETKEVEAIFAKYTKTQNQRSLKKPDAIHMFQNEFGLNEVEAESMFETFDKDKNSIMSIWEFQQFYSTAGESAHEILDKFHALDTDRSGKLDKEEARKGLEQMKTGTGRNLEEKEIEFFLKTTSDENGMIDLGMFVSLFTRLKLYTSAPPPKNAKCHVLGEME
ncbi:hypothetical protein FSP39_006990 [Pinctada imbricata]|uniref:EF-hand domain-containing protein n=1 Tax=Pinctada imbricata TaxID=66713 RepID=A0AA88YQN6_PINIB|nr:hypothetical protein FSP39_006990 [Pinctada imbricata]